MAKYPLPPATPESLLRTTLTNIKNPRHSDGKATRAIVILLEDRGSETTFTLKHCGLRHDEVLDTLAIIRNDLMPTRH